MHDRPGLNLSSAGTLGELLKILIGLSAALTALLTVHNQAPELCASRP
jgi:hypothetical protein